MTTARLLIGVAATTLVGLGADATAQVALPDGPNRELVSRTCGACHDIGTVVDAGGRSREDWIGTIDAMTSFGLNITLTERDLILQYLATYLPDPPRQ
jgi:cytochrome c5